MNSFDFWLPCFRISETDAVHPVPSVFSCSRRHHFVFPEKRAGKQWRRGPKRGGEEEGRGKKGKALMVVVGQRRKRRKGGISGRRRKRSGYYSEEQHVVNMGK